MIHTADGVLHDDKPELDRKIAQLEIIGELRNVQKLIVEEEINMALTYNIEKDIRYNQGLEKGLEAGTKKATVERNTAFVRRIVTGNTCARRLSLKLRPCAWQAVKYRMEKDIQFTSGNG